MSQLRKETIRFYEDDVDLIREFYPGGYGKPGINEVIRSIIKSWVDQNLRPVANQVEKGVPDVNTPFHSEPSVD